MEEKKASWWPIYMDYISIIYTDYISIITHTSKHKLELLSELKNPECT